MKTTRERALQAALDSLRGVLAQRSEPKDLGQSFEEIDIPIPDEPHYVRFGKATLEIWADDLVNPRARRHMRESDFEDIARVLKCIADAKQLRKAVFPPDRSCSRGRPRTNAPRDFLIALDYWIRREFSRGKKGRELSDFTATVQSLQRDGVGANIVRRARTAWRKPAKSFLCKFLESAGPAASEHDIDARLGRLHEQVRSEMCIYLASSDAH